MATSQKTFKVELREIWVRVMHVTVDEGTSREDIIDCAQQEADCAQQTSFDYSHMLPEQDYNVSEVAQ